MPVDLPPADAVAVIFTSTRTDADALGYDAAASKLAELAETQSGFLGLESARNPDGTGVTVSYWQDEASALAWRDNAEHAAIRELGRGRWYARYRTIITRVTRAYGWEA